MHPYQNAQQAYSGAIAANSAINALAQDRAVKTTAPIETIQNVIALISQQVAETLQRSQGLANELAGPVPSADDKQTYPEQTVLQRLQTISAAIGMANGELERAQRTLS